MTFDWHYAWLTLPELLHGLRLTALATLAGMSLALSLGLVLCVLRRGRSRTMALGAAGIVEFLRSTPLLIQMYFLFYVLPGLGISLRPFAAGALALGLHYAAYCSEVYRAGIESVPAGQWEAAQALNLSRRQIWRRVILPQALPPILPALGNYFVAMFKDTPMLSAITVLEVLQRAKLLGAEHFRYLEPLTLAGLLFLLLSLAAATFIRLGERRLARRGLSR